MGLTAEKTTVIAAFAPATHAEARAARAAVQALPPACAVEIRLDAMTENPDPAALRSCFPGRTLVATLRSEKEGGMSRRGQDEETALLAGCVDAGFDLVDVEYRGGASGRSDLLGFDPARVILSRHDVTGVPDAEVLEGLVRGMAGTAARFMKVVAAPKDSGDALRLLELQRGETAGGRLVAFGMGEAGIATRALAPYLGAPLSYGALVPGRGTAPGQLAARDLVDVYGIGRPRRVERLFALFGGMVSYSFSPAIHNANIEALSIDALYVPFALRSLANELVPLTAGLLGLGLPLVGASVTIPFKEEAARAAGLPEGVAVNTLVAPQTGEPPEATNTDRLAMEAALPKASRGERALVLGAGATARVAARVLRGKDYEVFVWNREERRAREVAHATGASVLSLLAGGGAPYSVLVNATPLGLAADDPLPCPETLLHAALVVLDAPYRAGGTALTVAAKRAGCTVVDGFALLLLQAAGQAELFTGHRTTASDLFDRLPPRFQALFETWRRPS